MIDRGKTVPDVRLYLVLGFAVFDGWYGRGEDSCDGCHSEEEDH
jgi:hypothetical protein